MKHTDTDRLERICGIILRLVPESQKSEPCAYISMNTMNGLKRVVQAALDASRADRAAPTERGDT